MSQRLSSAVRAATQNMQQSRSNSNQPQSLGEQFERGLSGLTAGIDQLMRPSPSDRDPGYVSQPVASGSRSPTDNIRTGPPAPDEEHEELPGYTRRSNGNSLAGGVGRGQAVKEHRLNTKNQKLEVSIESVGKHNFPVFIRNVADTIRGEVVVRLEKPEAITRVQIRLKVVVKTTVYRSHGGSSHNRHPITEEHLLLELSSSLYDKPPQEAEMQRLQGITTWPYEFRIPDGVRVNGQELALPPSFALSASDGWQSGGFEVASVKYYIKLTLARSGLFKPNDRIFAPVIFLQRHARPDMTSARAASLEGLPEAAPLLGPAEDPSGWNGRTAHQEPKRGLFTAKKGHMEATLLLPLPLIYGTRTVIPFYLRVVTGDPTVTGSSGNQRVRVDLVQRTSVVAQNIDSAYETFVGSGHVEQDDDKARRVPGEARYRGIIASTSARTPSFSAMGLTVGHAVVATIGELQVFIPVTIQAWPALLASRALSASANAPPEPELDVQEEQPDLPPSYFEVVEQGSEGKR